MFSAVVATNARLVGAAGMLTRQTISELLPAGMSLFPIPVASIVECVMAEWTVFKLD